MNMNMNMAKQKCKCGYEWATKSNLFLVTCPNCYKKVKNTKGLDYHELDKMKDSVIKNNNQKGEQGE